MKEIIYPNTNIDFKINYAIRSINIYLNNKKKITIYLN